MQAASRRLPWGGSIDRSRVVNFSFNGVRLSAHPGDTLASALMANGVDVIGRSFKYHRPRGFFGAGLEDPSSMLAVRDAHGYDPAVRAGQVLLAEGMEARSITGWPSPRFDLAAVAQPLSSLLTAGFYYKTFKWPSWRWFEPHVRKATGFGRPGTEPDRRVIEHRHASCDVLIVGGGPAGLAVAEALKDTTLRVFLADCHHALGGSLLWETAQIDGQSARHYCGKVLAALAASDGVTLLPSTLVSAAYENDVFTLVQSIHDAHGVRAERHWKLRPRHVVLATGMIDRPLLFEGNDRPGIMLSSAVRRLIGEFAVAPARRLAIYTNNDSGYLTAIDARHAGIQVAAIVDTRSAKSAMHADAARRQGIECLFDSQVRGSVGYRRLSSIIVCDASRTRRRIRCDGLAISGGWTPLIHLAAHRGVKPVYEEARSMHLCRELPRGWVAVGGANGALKLEDAIRQATQAAAVIAAAHATTTNNRVPRVSALCFGSVTPMWLPQQPVGERIWVDLQNDVKVSDIELAARENYASIEHLKRYTTLGMGTDQGRTSNVNGLAIMAMLTGREPADMGTTTFRPPFSAVRFDTIANARRGDSFHPRRLLPADSLHRELGAAMDDFGWERPDWYRSNGAAREAAVEVEMRAVRMAVGVFDGSSLGKIEVTGADAAMFLGKFYVSNMATLKPGHIRYSVMLREDGVIFDDGVVTCLRDGHFLASPTSSNAESVAAWFERWRQTEWPTMRVAVSPVTSNWAAVAIAGPQARQLLQRLRPDFDVSGAAFPHMEFREATIAGVPARVARISFTGELQYEISVPARYAAALLRALLATDAELAPRPVGLEAWMRLRLEKGYIHLGSDTNGRTTALDVGMGGIGAKRKDDFIGKRSLSLPFASSTEKEQLVGLVAVEGALQVGARVLSGDRHNVPCPTEGYVTSACFSPSLSQSIGLALIERGHQRDGEVVRVYCAGQIVRARICNRSFLDPANERLHL